MCQVGAADLLLYLKVRVGAAPFILDCTLMFRAGAATFTRLYLNILVGAADLLDYTRMFSVRAAAFILNYTQMF